MTGMTRRVPFTIAVLATLGLGGCSDARVNGPYVYGPTPGPESGICCRPGRFTMQQIRAGGQPCPVRPGLPPCEPQSPVIASNPVIEYDPGPRPYSAKGSPVPQRSRSAWN